MRVASHFASAESGIGLLLACLAAAFPISAQTTQGMIAGTVFDSETGRPLAGVVVEYARRDAGRIVFSGSGEADSQGRFAFPLLPPGTYQVRVCDRACPEFTSELPQRGAYQPQEIYGLELPVSARIEINFALRKLSEVWVQGIQRGLYEQSTTAIVHYYAADAAKLRSAYVQLTPFRTGALESTVSYVVDPGLIDSLPLAGRDVYAALVLEPAVTADSGTARGLGFSVNGQRPTASNYLLDGLENNNTLTTGPLSSLAPEAVQEYRISTANWSAEYGGTAGFLANVATRAGGQAWHGQAYFYLKNDAMNANTFQNNAHLIGRLPFKESEYGVQAGGRVWKKLFVSGSVDGYRSRGYQAPFLVNFPSPAVVTRLTASNPGRALLTSFPTPALGRGDGVLTPVEVRESVSLDRKLGLARADYVAGARRIMLRFVGNGFDWPDFIWYPYPGFTSGQTQPMYGFAAAYSESYGAGLTRELHAGWTRSSIEWNRAHPEIPTIVVSPVNGGDVPTVLPGSPSFYGLHYTNHNVEVNDTWTWVRGRHIVKVGGGVLLRSVGSLMSTGAAGEVTFNSMGFFEIARPSSYTAAMNRMPPLFEPPTYGRNYRNRQFAAFAEDTWRATPRLVVNVGIRAEHFGAPVNTGAVKDVMVELGAGSSFPQRIASATLVAPPAGDQPMYDAGRLNVVPRVGFAWNGGDGGQVVRGGYGIFYDRPFDNLWAISNNILVPPALNCSTATFDNLCAATATNPQGYLAPAATMLKVLQGVPFAPIFPSLTLMDPMLRNGYTQTWFVSVQKRAAQNIDVEVTTLGGMGRRLITTDVVNRAGGAQGRFNSGLPDILWRSSQGGSDYHALTALARYRGPRGSLQASYTWSHSIDNQSDPLLGDFFDLSFTNAGSADSGRAQAAFTTQFDSAADRATSDFDQRHNLLFYSWWAVPAASGPRWLEAVSRNWRVAEMAAVRSGFPFTVRSSATGALLNQRANLVNAGIVDAPPGAPAAPAATALLNAAAFAAPPTGIVGNSGRNAFAGPGLWSVDLSVSRSIALPRIGETRRLVFRADFYNALNHANLNNPDTRLGSPTFGQATWGRTGYRNGFPALIPLVETPRQIQMLLKLEF